MCSELRLCTPFYRILLCIKDVPVQTCKHNQSERNSSYQQMHSTVIIIDVHTQSIKMYLFEQTQESLGGTQSGQLTQCKNILTGFN